MKKKKLVALLLALCCTTTVGALTACGGGNNDDPNTNIEQTEFTVSFDSKGGTSVADQGVFGNGKITDPGAPTKYGYNFIGWYKNDACTEKWNFEADTVKGHMTLYALWQIKDATADTYFDFTALDDGTMAIAVKTGQTLPADVILPSVHEEKAVTAIKDGAFEGQAAVKSVLIPDSVKSIGSRALRNCTNLEQVLGGENVEKIDGAAFGGTKYDSNLSGGAVYLGKTLYKYAGGMYTDTELEVTAGTLGIAAGAFQDMEKLTAITLPAGLKNIGNYAFGGSTKGTGLTAVVIPDSVESIGDNAFRNAKSLATVTVGKGVKSIGANAFAGTAITSLTYNANAEVKDNSFAEVAANATIVFGNEVTVIPVSVTSKFTNLTAVTLGAEITEIPESAFDGKAKLATVTVNGTLTSIGAFAFRGTAITEFILNKEITAIGGSAFANCTSLTTVNYNAVNATGAPSTSLAFTGCSKLKTVTVGGEVTHIPAYLFKNCAALDTLTIGANVTNIGAEAFYGTAVASLTVPAKVATIGANAFGSCSALATVTYNATNATYEGTTTIFAAASTVTMGGGVTSIPAYFVKGNTAITTITLPTGVNVGDYAFQNCTALATITGYDTVGTVGAQAFEGSKYYEDNTADGIIVQGSVLTGYRGEMPANFTLDSSSIPAGKTVTSIAANAFKNQTNLVGVTLPASVVGIGANAFDGCTALVGTIDLSNVTEVGDAAFNGCNGLTAITLGEGLTKIGANAFKNCSQATMTLKANSLTELGASAFYGCAKLTSVEVNGVAEIPANTFTNAGLTSVKLGEAVETVGDSWASLSSVTEFTAPSLKYIGNYGLADLKVTTYSVENIVTFGNGALAGFANPNVVIGANCTEIGLHLFNRQGRDNNQNITYTPTTTLQSLTVNSTTLTKIPERLAAGCNALTTVTLAANITELGDYAFSGTGVTAFDFTNITKFDDYVFDGCSGLTANNLTLNATLGTGVFKDCSKLTGKLTLGGTQVTIGGSAFSGAKFTEVSVGAGVKSVGAAAFRGNAITKLTIAEGITDIGSMAFDTIACAYVELPASLSSLGDSVFYDLMKTNVKVVKLQSGNVTLGKNSEKYTYIVPDANLNAYKQDNETCTFYGASEVTENFLVVKNGILSGDLMNASTVEIPAGVTGIAKGALDNATTVTVAAENTALKVVENVVYSKDGATLVCFPKANATQEYEIAETVTAIAENAFAGTTLQKVTMKATTPPTLGTGAFDGSSAMIYVPQVAVDTYKAAGGWSTYASVIFAEGVVVEWVVEDGTLISYNGTDTEVVIPDEVTKISATAFATTGAQITKLTIGKNVAEVEATWFQYFTAIDEFVYNSKNVILGGSLNDGRIIFDGASTAKKSFILTFGNNVTEIAPYFCINARSYITALDFGSAQITKIGKNAFARCSKITSVPSLPTTLLEMGDEAFGSCSGMSGEVTIPAGLVIIPQKAFNSCSKITGVTFMGNVTEIGSSAFNGCPITSLTLPDSVKTIGGNAFTKSAFSELIVPESVTSVAFNAFYNNTMLTKVTWNAVAAQTESMSAFNGNTALTTFIIGANVTSLPSSLFQNLTAMTSLTVKAATPPAASSAFTAFTPNAALKIYVPADSVDTYKAATGWSAYADKIEAIPAETPTPDPAPANLEALPADNKNNG